MVGVAVKTATDSVDSFISSLLQADLAMINQRDIRALMDSNAAIRHLVRECHEAEMAEIAKAAVGGAWEKVQTQLEAELSEKGVTGRFAEE